MNDIAVRERLKYCFFSNNICEKITRFWLAENSAV